MTNEQLINVLEQHSHWVKKDCDGWEEMRANLSCANLRGANLRDANLSYANLGCADLRDANLSCTNLGCTNLRGADLSYANLSCTNLRGADLSYANLNYVNLSYANLGCTNLGCTNLSYANLSYANLSYANLSYANLSYANLSDANLSDAKDIPFVPMACPDTGSFIAYKKACGGHIVKLEIPEDARRSSATGRKCRCNKAKVLEIQKPDGSVADITSVSSCNDVDFIYKIGEVVTVDDFDENRWNECAPGIHFFINRQEAVNYGA